jgi:hypothetical protein
MQKTIPTFTLSINDICKTEKQKAKFRASLKNKTRQIINKEKLSDWIYDNCKWFHNFDKDSFCTIDITLDNPSLDTQNGKRFHNEDENTKHYHWYFPRLGSWDYAEKRIFNDLKKGVIKIEERI